MLAPNPSSPPADDVDLEASAEIEDVRASLRATLKKIAGKRTMRLNEDSKLFRLAARLTKLATPDDASRRRRYLEDAIPDPVPDL